MTETAPKHSNTTLLPPVGVLEPGKLGVISRNREEIRSFDSKRISRAIKNAFIAAEGEATTTSTRVYAIVEELTNQIVSTINNRYPQGGVLSTLKTSKIKSS